jgi:hypothetical protein
VSAILAATCSAPRGGERGKERERKRESIVDRMARVYQLVVQARCIRRRRLHSNHRCSLISYLLYRPADRISILFAFQSTDKYSELRTYVVIDPVIRSAICVPYCNPILSTFDETGWLSYWHAV